MKLLPVFVFLSLLLFKICPCWGQSEIVVEYGEKYICGDSFEITIPDQPSTTMMHTRHVLTLDKISPLTKEKMKISDVEAQAEKGEILLPVRIKLRNLTPFIYQGLKPESFQLIGYMVDQKQVYLPEIIEPYDFDDYDCFISLLHFFPLRQLDIFLVYRVNPVLINWELHVNPQATYETSQYGEITYDSILGQVPCNVLLLFPSIQDGQTRQVIEYERSAKDGTFI